MAEQFQVVKPRKRKPLDGKCKSVDIKQRWSPRGRLWPRGHIFNSLASNPHVLGLGLEPSSPQKLAFPRLEDSTNFCIVENARNLAKNLHLLPLRKVHLHIA